MLLRKVGLLWNFLHLVLLMITVEASFALCYSP